MKIKSALVILLATALPLSVGCGGSMQDDMMVRAKALAEARRADREKEAAAAAEKKKQAAEEATKPPEQAEAKEPTAKAAPTPETTAATAKPAASKPVAPKPAAPKPVAPKPASAQQDAVQPMVSTAPKPPADAPITNDRPSFAMVVPSETVPLSSAPPAGVTIPPIAGLMPGGSTGGIASGSADDFPAMNFGNEEDLTNPTIANANAPVATGDTPIPPTADLKDASDKLRELFGEQMEQAKTVADRIAIGKLLLQQSESVSNDPAGLYAMLQAARTIGCSTGNLPLAQEANARIQQTFAIDQQQMKIDTIRRFTSTAYTPHRDVDVNGFGTLATGVLTGAIEKDDYKVASLCSNLIGRMVRLGDQSLTPEASEQLEKYLKLAHNKYKSSVLSMEVLQANPADPEAAAVVGMYFCFVRGNWEEGTRLLRLASDKKLSKAAITDGTATAQDTATSMVDAGDAWWAASQHAKDPLLEYFGRGRALHWYRQALPMMGETLDRLRVTGRLKDYPEALDGSLVESITRVAGSNTPAVEFLTEK